MDQTEKQVIDGLFDRLRQAEHGSGPRDAEAERHIANLVSQQPAAPYYMAQAILVQEHALKTAQERIAELEGEIKEAPSVAAGGGFLGGLFGGNPAQVRERQNSGSVPRTGGGFRYPREEANEDAPESPVAKYNRTGQGGGFLAGAMQTAVGVAGGVVVGNMLASMFGVGKSAQASQGEAAKEQQPEPQDASNADDRDDDPQVEDASMDDDDSWFGDFDGGFDI
jgi:hypothetical protein